MIEKECEKSATISNRVINNVRDEINVSQHFRGFLKIARNKCLPNISELMINPKQSVRTIEYEKRVWEISMRWGTKNGNSDD